MREFLKKRGTLSCISSLVAIVAGLLLGLALLFGFNPAKAMYGFRNMMLTGVTSLEKLGKVFYTAAPLLMTGLAVGFAFKTGLFNIGASGQFTMGAFFALVGAIQFRLPWWACMLLAIIGGAIWGSIPGIFKAFFNVNEVISAIMFNWIGLFVVNMSIANMPMMLGTAWGESVANRTGKLAKANVDAIVPKLGLDNLMKSSYVNAGILIAIVCAVVIWVILNKTTLGYELKACGYNRDASQYAGINAKRNIVLAMTISGALAGLGGAIYFLSGSVQYTLDKVLQPMGFNGIPVALLGVSHPLATIFSALFVSYLQVGGDAMQPEFTKEIIDIIIAAIIYMSAFALLMQEGIRKLLNKKRKAEPEAAAAEAGKAQTEQSKEGEKA